MKRQGTGLGLPEGIGLDLCVGTGRSHRGRKTPSPLARSLYDRLVQPLPHTKSCFACGRHNPLGLQLHLFSDGNKVQAEFTPAPHHAGFKGVVHGGITATLLDEIMAWTCAAVGGRFAYCAELSVRFLRPLRTGQTVTALGELTLNGRRLFEARAEILHESEGLLATAQGKYIPVSEQDLSRFAEDFVGDPTEFLRKASRR